MYVSYVGTGLWRGCVFGLWLDTLDTSQKSVGVIPDIVEYFFEYYTSAS